jgi:hypothetical protein
MIVYHYRDNNNATQAGDNILVLDTSKYNNIK